MDWFVISKTTADSPHATCLSELHTLNVAVRVKPIWQKSADLQAHTYFIETGKVVNEVYYIILDDAQDTSIAF